MNNPAFVFANISEDDHNLDREYLQNFSGMNGLRYGVYPTTRGISLDHHVTILNLELSPVNM